MLQGSDKVDIHGDNVVVDGSKEATYQASAGKATFSASDTATLKVSSQAVVCNTSKVGVAGKKIQSDAQGNHEITGSLVKIN